MHDAETLAAVLSQSRGCGSEVLWAAVALILLLFPAAAAAPVSFAAADVVDLSGLIRLALVAFFVLAPALVMIGSNYGGGTPAVASCSVLTC